MNYHKLLFFQMIGVMLLSTAGCSRTSPPLTTPIAPPVVSERTDEVRTLPTTWLPIDDTSVLFRTIPNLQQSPKPDDISRDVGVAAAAANDTLYLLGDDGIEFPVSDYTLDTWPSDTGAVFVDVSLSKRAAMVLETWSSKYVRSTMLMCVDGKVHSMAVAGGRNKCP